MNVLLIHPNRTYPSGVQAPAVGLPVGILSIASSLRAHAISVSVLDCLLHAETQLSADAGWIQMGISDEVLRAELRRRQPQIVGISCPFTSQWENAAHLVSVVANELPNASIVLGGPHATVCARQILLEVPHVQYVVAGEGELSMPRLVRAIEAADLHSLTAIPGLVWRDFAGVIQQNPVEPIVKLDQLPLPAYDLVDFERMFALQQQGIGSRGATLRTASIITSRGCPYTCIFCSIHLTMGRLWRPHSPDYVLAHIRHLVEQCGVRHLHIEDDNFTFRPDRARAICGKLTDAHLPLTWSTPNGVRADTLSEELLADMKASGCVEIAIAAESGDQDVLTRIVKKHLDLRAIERAAALIHKMGLRAGCFWMLGFPGESKKNLRATMRLAQHFYERYDCSPLLNVVTPLPGTELARIVQQKGYLVRSMQPRNLIVATAGTAKGQGMIATPEFDPEYLRKCVLRLNRSIRLLRLQKLLRSPRKLGNLAQQRLWRFVAYANSKLR